MCALKTQSYERFCATNGSCINSRQASMRWRHQWLQCSVGLRHVKPGFWATKGPSICNTTYMGLVWMLGEQVRSVRTSVHCWPLKTIQTTLCDTTTCLKPANLLLMPNSVLSLALLLFWVSYCGPATQHSQSKPPGEPLDPLQSWCAHSTFHLITFDTETCGWGCRQLCRVISNDHEPQSAALAGPCPFGNAFHVMLRNTERGARQCKVSCGVGVP
jgi:hypothetical protein